MKVQYGVSHAAFFYVGKTNIEIYGYIFCFSSSSLRNKSYICIIFVKRIKKTNLKTAF